MRPTSQNGYEDIFSGNCLFTNYLLFESYTFHFLNLTKPYSWSVMKKMLDINLYPKRG